MHTRTRNDAAIRRTQIRLVREDARAPHRGRGDTHDLPLERRDARGPRPTLEDVRDPHCVLSDTIAPPLVRVRTRDRPTRRDVSLETHTAADTRCTSSSFKN